MKKTFLFALLILAIAYPTVGFGVVCDLDSFNYTSAINDSEASYYYDSDGNMVVNCPMTCTCNLRLKSPCNPDNIEGKAGQSCYDDYMKSVSATTTASFSIRNLNIIQRQTASAVLCNTAIGLYMSYERTANQRCEAACRTALGGNLEQRDVRPTCLKTSTPTPTPTRSETETPEPTPTPTPSQSPSPTVVPTPTPIPTGTPTTWPTSPGTPTWTPTLVPTETSAPTWTPTPTPTETPWFKWFR